MTNKKKIELVLTYDVPQLIHLQEMTVRELRKQNLPPTVTVMQEDILRVLKAVGQMELIDVGVS